MTPKNKPAPEECKERDALLTLINALWEEYKLGEVYQGWRDAEPTMDRDFIVTHKCVLKLPAALQIPFRNAWNAYQGIE